MSLLVVSEILTSDDKYYFCNKENSQQPIQMQLSKKQKTFSWCFAAFLKSASIFERIILIAYLSHLNRDKLPQANQIELSKKQTNFSQFFATFLKFTSNFGFFLKKIALMASVFWKLETATDVIS